MALAPAGGWAQGDESHEETLAYFRTMQDTLKTAAPHAEALLATPERSLIHAPTLLLPRDSARSQRAYR